MTFQVAYAVVNREQHILSTKEIDSLMAKLLNEKLQSIDTAKNVAAGNYKDGRNNEPNAMFEHLQMKPKPTTTYKAKSLFVHLKGN